MRNQLERAAVSVSNNIAEGFERGTTMELVHFLYISKGSSGECRSMLRMCERAERFSDLKFEISDLIGRAVNVSKQLNGWIESLKNSEIKGVEFVNDTERGRVQKKKELDDFDREMAEFREKHVEWLNRRVKEPGLTIEDVMDGK